MKDGKYLENNYIVSFIGFAPADDPEIVVYVAVDNPKGVTQFGGVVAAQLLGIFCGCTSCYGSETEKRTS